MINHISTQLGLQLTEKRFCVVIKYKNEDRADAERIIALYNACFSVGKNIKEFVLCYIGNQLYTVMIFVDVKEKSRIVLKLKEDISKHCVGAIQIGVGRSYEEIEKLNYSRVEAYEALFNIVEHTDIAYIEDLYVTQNMTAQKLEQEKKRVISQFKRGELQQAMENVEQLVEKVRLETPIREDLPYPTSIRRTIVELLVEIMHICADAGIDVDKKLNYQDPYRRVFELKSTPDILQWFSETIHVLHTCVQERNTKTESNMLLLAKKCISEHISDPQLSLSLVSEELGITSTYFSSFFIRETGIGFNEYITNSRIQKAQELLQTTNQKINEIAFACGFRSASYFIANGLVSR